MYVLATMHDERYLPLANITLDHNKIPYCDKHGYELAVKTEGWSDIVYFDKIQFLIDILEYNPEVKWIWWLDTDALITNFDKKIEDVIDDNYHLIFTTDVNGMNCGSFFIKNSPESIAWLKVILNFKELYKTKKWDNPEQTPMIMTYIRYRDIIKLHPQRDFNSYMYGLYPGVSNIDMLHTDGEWQEGDWVLHWPGISNQQRAMLAQEVWPKIINTP